MRNPTRCFGRSGSQQPRDPWPCGSPEHVLPAWTAAITSSTTLLAGARSAAPYRSIAIVRRPAQRHRSGERTDGEGAIAQPDGAAGRHGEPFPRPHLHGRTVRLNDERPVGGAPVLQPEPGGVDAEAHVRA